MASVYAGVKRRGKKGVPYGVNALVQAQKFGLDLEKLLSP